MKKLQKKIKATLLQKVELLKKDGLPASERNEIRKDIEVLSKAIK